MEVTLFLEIHSFLFVIFCYVWVITATLKERTDPGVADDPSWYRHDVEKHEQA